jgi:hypothetical protein
MHSNSDIPAMRRAHIHVQSAAGLPWLKTLKYTKTHSGLGALLCLCSSRGLGVICERRRAGEDAQGFKKLVGASTNNKRDLKKKALRGLEHLVEWSERYETSKLATARRFVDVFDSPSAVILSKDGIVEFIHRKKTFLFVELKKGMHPGNALTVRFSGSGMDARTRVD